MQTPNFRANHEASWGNCNAVLASPCQNFGAQGPPGSEPSNSAEKHSRKYENARHSSDGATNKRIAEFQKNDRLQQLQALSGKNPASLLEREIKYR